MAKNSAGQDRGGAGEHIGGAAAGHEAAARADAEPAAFRALQQHHADQASTSIRWMTITTCCIRPNPSKLHRAGLPAQAALALI